MLEVHTITGNGPIETIPLLEVMIPLQKVTDPYHQFGKHGIVNLIKGQVKMSI